MATVLWQNYVNQSYTRYCVSLNVIGLLGVVNRCADRSTIHLYGFLVGHFALSGSDRGNFGGEVCCGKSEISVSTLISEFHCNMNWYIVVI